MPSKNDIAKAVEVLEEQHLHVYQLLYINGLTNPSGQPVSVKREMFGANRLTNVIRVSVSSNPELYFFVRYATTDNDILNLTKLMLENKNKEKSFPEACCCFAIKNPCVCSLSFNCILHGSTHIGTHD